MSCYTAQKQGSKANRRGLGPLPSLLALFANAAAAELSQTVRWAGGLVCPRCTADGSKGRNATKYCKYGHLQRLLIFRIVGIVAALDHVVRPKEIYNRRSPTPLSQEPRNKKGERRDAVPSWRACPVCRQRGGSRTVPDGTMERRDVLSPLQA